MPQYKQYINDGKTIVTSPHKLYGNDSNDLSLQLRKYDVDQIILAGMSANLCTENHMRELLEMGFELAVITDTTAAAMLPSGCTRRMRHSCIVTSPVAAVTMG